MRQKLAKNNSFRKNLTNFILNGILTKWAFSMPSSHFRAKIVTFSSQNRVEIVVILLPKSPCRESVNRFGKSLQNYYSVAGRTKRLSRKSH